MKYMCFDTRAYFNKQTNSNRFCIEPRTDVQFKEHCYCIMDVFNGFSVDECWVCNLYVT